MEIAVASGVNNGVNLGESENIGIKFLKSRAADDPLLGQRQEDLKIAVRLRKPSNFKELEQFCLEEWAKIPVARCGKLRDLGRDHTCEKHVRVSHYMDNDDSRIRGTLCPSLIGRGNLYDIVAMATIMTSTSILCPSLNQKRCSCAVPDAARSSSEYCACRYHRPYTPWDSSRSQCMARNHSPLIPHHIEANRIISTPQRLSAGADLLIGRQFTAATSAMVTQTHITDASSWIPGDRKRTREFIESDFSESKRSKRGEKSGKGLRHFSMKVCEKVQTKGTTSYNEVADELVAEFTSSAGQLPSDSAYDQKNIRRRVYDALNVLMAMNIISKEKKEIKWIGLPSNSVQEYREAEEDRAHKAEECSAPGTAAPANRLQAPRTKKPAKRTTESNSSRSKLHHQAAIHHCETQARRRFEYLFNFDNAFEIHDDIEVLKRMGMSFGLESGKCTSENLKLAKSFVPRALEGYVSDMASGTSWADQGLPFSTSQTASAAHTAGTTTYSHSSVNTGLFFDADLSLTNSSHHSSSGTSHYTESRGETPCSFDDDEDDEDDSSSLE
ncbi:unnamed protein product [Ranitomeya imitator]|uniref:Transcription factor n=1 Tax=Ranitomeya imitator TaxID=111125 RepID=A0ABN9MH55_9NEOB|nr:unnamed protein product [Ranitomeya imitator]